MLTLLTACCLHFSLPSHPSHQKTDQKDRYERANCLHPHPGNAWGDLGETRAWWLVGAGVEKMMVVVLRVTDNRMGWELDLGILPQEECLRPGCQQLRVWLRPAVDDRKEEPGPATGMRKMEEIYPLSSWKREWNRGRSQATCALELR